MYLFSNYKLSKNNYFSLLLALFPFSFIAGNLVININAILLILSSLIFFNKKLFTINFYLLDKFIFLFFLLILFTGAFNDYFLYLDEISWRGSFATIKKSLYFSRYLLFYISLRYLVEKNYLQFKYFFISCTLASLFVCFDIFFQFKYGFDIFGYETFNRKLGGPFGDELIAGAFIQRFSLFAFFLFPIFYSKQSKAFLKYIIPLLFIIFLLGIVLSGNRMPTILFIFSIVLIVIFQEQVRKYIFHFVIIFSIIFVTIFNFNSEVNQNFRNFHKSVSSMANIVIKKDFNNKSSPQYFKEFATFYDTWLLNKYIGGGIKNFRYYCHVRPNINKDDKFICNMHPHNYYLEILTETGLIGFSIVSLIFLIVLYNSLIKKYFFRSHLNNNNLIIPFIFLFIVEIFPLKSTGSFFTTGNTTYLIIIMGILIGLARKDNSIEKKN
jgi:O-antigen ligase